MINSESFKCKTGIIRKTSSLCKTREAEFAVPLKHVSNFWRRLDKPLINSQVNLILTWSKNGVITDTPTQDADPNVDPPLSEIRPPTGATLKIKDTKLYVPVATLLNQDDNKLLEHLKTRFKRTIQWNKYRSKMTNWAKNNYLDNLVEPMFIKASRFFVLLFKNDDERISSTNYYTSNVEIKDFNLLIDGKFSFDSPIKNKGKAYEKIIEMRKNNDYTTVSLLD